MATKTETKVVRIDTSCAGERLNYQPGDLVRFPTEIAERFIARGVAEEIPEQAVSQEIARGGRGIKEHRMLRPGEQR